MEEIDVELAREMIVLKAKDLGLSDKKLDALDAVVCAFLSIEDPEPLIFPA